MDFFNSFLGILSTEMFLLIILILIVSMRLLNSKNKDFEKLTDFLDNVDEETLIRLVSIDERSLDHRDTIEKNIKNLVNEKKYLNNKIKDDFEAGDCVKKISREYMSIIEAVEAIKTRENTKLQEDNILLLDKINKLISESRGK